MGELLPLAVLTDPEPIKVGDRVRSYDFPDDPREDARGCYYEGRVVAIGRFAFDGEACDRYKIAVMKRYWLGKPQLLSVDRYVFPPANGTPIAARPGAVTHGVVKLPF